MYLSMFKEAPDGDGTGSTGGTAATSGASTTGAATTSGTTGAGGTASTAAAWHGITDPAEAAYVQNKGWQSPADVIKSYQGAEKLIGRDPSTLVTLPRSDDPEGFRQVMQKLGLPESPDKYDFGKPAAGETWDDGYVKWAKDTFHKAGVPAGPAKQIIAEHNAYLKGLAEKQVQDRQLATQTDKAALLREWGGGHERMMNAAKTAATSLGFDADMIDAIEAKKGYAGTMKFFAELGQKLGEDKFVAGNGTQRFGDSLTPDEAKQQWEAAKLDKNFTAALLDNQHPGHKAAKEKQSRLMAIMFPEK